MPFVDGLQWSNGIYLFNVFLKKYVGFGVFFLFSFCFVTVLLCHA